MSYEQRAREWLEVNDGPAVPPRSSVASLTALCESIAAEARGQASSAAFCAAAHLVEALVADGWYDWRAIVQKVRALAPRPGVRLVAREDLAHALETCGCVYGCATPADGPEWPAAHTEAIDRLRAGEEG